MGIDAMTPKLQVPAEIDHDREERWCRQGTRQLDTVFAAERFIDQVGFTACLAVRGDRDCRRTSPSVGDATR
jgi:hypothetical protein